MEGLIIITIVVWFSEAFFPPHSWRALLFKKHCAVEVKSLSPRPHIPSLAGCLVKSRKLVALEGSPWLTPVRIRGLEGGTAGIKWEEVACWTDSWSGLHCEVTRKLLKSLFSWFAAVCHSSAPTAATLFPTGLNLSKGILCMSELSLITKDSRVVGERV